MGGGKRAHGRPGSNLGAALKSARDKKNAGARQVHDKDHGEHLHVSEIHQKEAHKVDLAISSTEPDHIADFLATVQMANKEFEVEHPEHHQMKIIDTTVDVDYTETIRQMSEIRQDILIPRRPLWDENTTKEQLDRAEKDTFLIWRRELAEKEENSKAVFTPFEKNIEFWRQLWRVIERSDLVVQLVDARRPLLFRCSDLEKYVLEVAERQGDEPDRKQNLLLLNKADLVSEEQRKIWANYFQKEGIEFFFFSAIEEQEKIEDEKEKEAAEKESKAEERLQAQLDALKADFEEEADEEDEEVEEITPVELPSNSWDIYNVEQLKLYIKEKRRDKFRFNKENVTVGMVGYPNVGKSSTINVLIADKKVSVSATPGKTKHFQTLFCGSDREIMLCDCPGLVFPSQVTMKEELVLAGVLPFNHIRDYTSPVELLTQMIPRNKLEAAYGIAIQKPGPGDDPDRPPNAGEFLDPFAAGRGFRTARGQPDRSRGARLSIKDFINGRLLYVNPPPGFEDKEAFKKMTIETEKDLVKLERRLKLVEKKMFESLKMDRMDKAFFAQASVQAHLHARTGQDGKFATQRQNGKQRLQDLKPRKKDKQRRIREKQYRAENVGQPDWLY